MIGPSVYIMLGHDGTILYVGKSLRGPERIKAHRDKDWWADVAQIDLIHCETQVQASAVEQNMIEDLGPVWNLQHRDLESPVLRPVASCTACGGNVYPWIAEGQEKGVRAWV